MDVTTEADAPPRKPKQAFLKRGEGVKRRIDAYKYRRPLAEGSKGIPGGQPAPSDQAQQSAAEHQHKEGHDRQPGHAGEVWDSSVPYSYRGNGTTKAHSTEASSYNPQPAEEDLELEEFRALEREIWGGSHQQGHVQQQQPVHDIQQQSAKQRPLSPQSSSATLSPEAAEAAALAAYGDSMGIDTEDPGVDSSHNSSSQLIQFQDDTEWVDTEFSFAAGLAEELAHTAHLQPKQQQQHQMQLQQRHLAGHTPANGLDAADAPSQPYVQSLFAAKSGNSSTRTASAGSKAQQHQRNGTNSNSQENPAVYGGQDPDDMQQQMVAVPAEVVQKWQQLEAAQPSLQQEKAGLRKMRQELEKAAARMEQERQAWEKQKAAAQSSMEAWRSEEARRLARERRVLEQQSKALLKLPSKKEKSALDAFEQQLEKEKSDAKAAAARHRLTVERLRCQIKELQDRNAELREEVRWHEAQQLNATAFAAADARSRRKPPTSTAQTQTDACLVQELIPTAAAAAAATAMAIRLEGAVQQQQQGAAAKESDSLYAALFGDDEDDDFAAAEAAAGTSAAESSGQRQAMHAAGQHAGSCNKLSAEASATTVAVSAGNKGQQQLAGVPPGAQLGRKVGNNVTLKPGISWASSPQKQQQQRQGQSQAVERSSANDQHDASYSSSTAQQCFSASNQVPGVNSDDTFTFASVASHGAPVHSSSASWGSQQQWQQPQQMQEPAERGSSNSRFNQHDPVTMTSYSNPNSVHHKYNDQVQQQQQQQHPTYAATSTKSQTKAAAAEPAAAYRSSSSSRRGSPAAVISGHQLLQELQHPDGKVEQMYADGTRVLMFANGTSKTTGPDGGTCIRFTNGDVKRQTADGRTDYYYAEVATWQSTHASGIEVFYFPTGQIEGHHPDGMLDIIFPDGTIKRVMPDGFEQEITAGLLSNAVQQPPPELDRL